MAEGDLIAVVAPGSPIGADRLAAGVAELRRIGYRVRYRDDILAADTFLAGDHRRRTEEFVETLRDPEVKAIVCARGGYGSNYLVERLAAEALAEPKIVMGYSDITTLLMWLCQHAGWVTFHGPMVTLEFAQGRTGYHEPAFRTAVSCRTGGWKGSGGSRRLRRGAAEGVLLGGCLPMLTASLGTPREIQTDGAILVLEDVAAKPYQIDRMLFHLREAGKFDNVRGIVFGQMLECRQHDDQGYTLQDVILRALDGLDVPMVYGFRTGHTDGSMVTLPLGVRARLSAGDRVRLEILDAAVV